MGAGQEPSGGTDDRSPFWTFQGQGAKNLAPCIRYSVTEEPIEPGERKFQVLIEDAFDIVTVIEIDGTIRHAVPAFERVLGYPPGELDGRSIFDLIHPDDLSIVRAEFEISLKQPGPSETLEARFRHRDGGWRLLRGRGRSMIDDPAIRGILLTTRDVTPEGDDGRGPPPLDRFLIREGDTTRIVSAGGVEWIESVGDYACLHVGGRTHVLRATLTDLEDRLEPQGFARIHRSIIVNLGRIREIRMRKYGDRTVVLEDGTRLRMSRTYRQEVEERLARTD